MRDILYCLLVCGLTTAAQARLSVVTTTTDLAALAVEIGGSDLSVESICRGTQDPHFIEAKPSFAIKVNHADLVVSIGLGLEIGWLPSILDLARNPKVIRGGPGFLEVGPLIDVLEVPKGTVTRADGDVHPEGNPHITLDPIRAGLIALKMAQRLGELDPAHRGVFEERAKALQSRFADKTKGWQARIARSHVTQIITHHKTLSYFFDRFHIENPAILEPKPGIPPTTKHTLEVISLLKDRKVPLILIENFFDIAVAKRVAEEAPTVRILSVPVSVGGEPAVKSLDDLYEFLVSAIEQPGTKSSEPKS